MFDEGRLVRGRGADPSGLVFATLDVETTGLSPRRGARVCEVAVVRMRGDGTVLNEYSTLVDPGVRINNSEFHGITNTQVAGAPRFTEIAGDLAAMLSDAVVVAHNLPYEDSFLTAEFGAVGVEGWTLPGLCTLRTLRTQVDRHGRREPYRRHQLYRWMTGENVREGHHALGDARQQARMLRLLLSESPQRLGWQGARVRTLPPIPRTGTVAPRPADLRKGTAGWIANLAAGLPDMRPPPQPRDRAATAYRNELARVLDNGRVVGDDAHRLAALATSAGFTRATLVRAHEALFVEARTRVEAQGPLDAGRRRELARVARELGVAHIARDVIDPVEQEDARRKGPLKGWRIVPVGDSEEVAAVVDHARSLGAVIGKNVTRTVRLVVADEGSSDPVVERARDEGHRVVTPAEAWEAVVEATAQAGHEPSGDGPVGRGTDGIFGRGGRPEVWQDSWRPRELSDQQYHDMFVAPYAPHPAQVKVPAAGRGCASAALLRVVVAGTVAVPALAHLWPF